MKVHPFLRTNSEYNISRDTGKGITNNGYSGIKYVEYTVSDELYKRSKEAARCYLSVGNIPMMLNKLYSTINYENRMYSII